MDDSGAGPGAGQSHLTFLTRRGCPLCDETLEVVLRHASGSVVVVDIDLDLDLLARYNELVPVLVGTDGSVLATGPLSSSEVKRLVRRLRR